MKGVELGVVVSIKDANEITSSSSQTGIEVLCLRLGVGDAEQEQVGMPTGDLFELDLDRQIAGGVVGENHLQSRRVVDRQEMLDGFDDRGRLVGEVGADDCRGGRLGGARHLRSPVVSRGIKALGPDQCCGRHQSDDDRDVYNPGDVEADLGQPVVDKERHDQPEDQRDQHLHDLPDRVVIGGFLVSGVRWQPAVRLEVLDRSCFQSRAGSAFESCRSVEVAAFLELRQNRLSAPF